MTPREILIEARHLLITKGWVPHPGHNGPFCAALAIQAASSDITEYDALHALANAIDGRSFYSRSVSVCDVIYEWNDRQTSIDPILNAFDAAIASLESTVYDSCKRSN